MFVFNDLSEKSDIEKIFFNKLIRIILHILMSVFLKRADNEPFQFWKDLLFFLQ